MGKPARFRAVARHQGQAGRFPARAASGRALLLLALLVLAACARPLPGPENGYAGLSLPQYLAAMRDARAFEVERLYEPPETLLETADGTGAYPPGYALLSNGPVTLLLARGATTYQGFENALAVGLADGDLRIYGERACPGMDQPVQGRPRLLSWGPYAGSLAVLGDAEDIVYVYDADTCSLREAVPTSAPVEHMALSPFGDLLAVADPAGRILLGSPTGGKKPLPLESEPLLALGFGPDGGMLFTVTPDGRIGRINARSGERSGSFQAGGGPFAAARFQGRYIVLTAPGGKRTAWDLAEEKQVPFSRKLAQFRLHDGDLLYRTWNGVLHLTPYPDAPRFQVDHSPSLRLVRVLDLDGRTRYYDQDSGREAHGYPATDWEHVPTNEKGNFCISGRCYVLTDRAFQWDHDVLLCRSVPGVGRFLWWTRETHPEQFSPLPGHLPERESILADVAAPWSPIVPPREFP